MSLTIVNAEKILQGRFGEPVKKSTKKVIGFKTHVGRVLALHREAKETRIWFQPPAPPQLGGVTLMNSSAKNDNLSGPLSSLNKSAALRVELDGEAALHRFLDWYAGSLTTKTLPVAELKLDPNALSDAKDNGRIVGGREESIKAMCLSVENTVKNSNGHIVQRTVKDKELRMSPEELEKLIASMLNLQDNRCALTGILFQYHEPDGDKNLLPSLDRIDSNGHYEVGNLQIVCQFINFWKGSNDNAEFHRLLILVRGQEV